MINKYGTDKAIRCGHKKRMWISSGNVDGTDKAKKASATENDERIRDSLCLRLPWQHAHIENKPQGGAQECAERNLRRC